MLFGGGEERGGKKEKEVEKEADDCDVGERRRKGAKEDGGGLPVQLLKAQKSDCAHVIKVEKMPSSLICVFVHTREKLNRLFCGANADCH